MAVETLPKDTAPNLTPREQEIFNLLLDGSIPKEIAYKLNVSYDTVIAHQKSMYRKLDVHNINEFMVKFRSVGDASVENKRKKPPLKIIIPVVAVVLLAIPLILYLQWKAPIDTVFSPWIPFNDNNGSEKTVATITNEIIDGREQECITITGKQADGNDRGVWTGIYGMPDGPTLEAFQKKMRSFSFKVIGDGNRYTARLPTYETNDGDHFAYEFQTIKDEVVTVKVNVPEDLTQIVWNGNVKEFKQNSIMFFQIQIIDPGPFYLKFWDIKLYK